LRPKALASMKAAPAVMPLLVRGEDRRGYDGPFSSTATSSRAESHPQRDRSGAHVLEDACPDEQRGHLVLIEFRGGAADVALSS
jgi:hypothetical protein